MFTALLFSIGALTAQDTSSSVRDELASYYKTSKRPASWDASIKKLASANGEDRKKAATHIVDLMDQSWQDEQSGKAPWLATPYWGGRRENPARNLRSSIVDSLKDTPATAEILPVIQWLLRNEPQMSLQEQVAGALGKLDGKEADEYRRTLLLQPHPNAVVMGMLLAQLNERKVALPADRLRELCHHHRQVIRDSARKLNQTLKGADPGPFDPVQAFKSPAVRRTLDDLQALLIDLPGKDADFVEVTIRYLQKEQVKETDKFSGWLLKQEKNEVTIYSPYGTHKTYRDKEKTKISVSERIENGVRSWQIDVVTAVTVAKLNVANYVKEIADIRAKGNKEFELSPRGGLTGQFQGQGASLTEVILAAWLDRAGKPDLAASILLPALDTLYEDRHVVEMTRHRLGDLLGYRMLVAFVGDRDYEESLKLARVLATHYPGTQFHEHAKGLAEQLPRRMDDFKTFKLPTPKEWATMKEKMSRREQIDFLCQRLRLLNCFQMGQPGGYISSETQYAEPCGLSENAAWGLNKGKTEVINPVVELAGQRDGFFLKGEERSKGLDLTVADIPALAPYLRDEWYLLIVSFWRDFHPGRDLATSRPYIAGWINGLAQHDLCKLDLVAKMTPAEKDEHIKKIIAWSEENKNKTQEDLVVAAIQAEIERKVEWRRVADRVEVLVKTKSPKALAFVEHYLGEKDDDGYYLPDLLSHAQTLDAAKASAWAKRFLDHKSGRLRMQAAMIVFEAGDKDRTIPILAILLEKGSAYDIRSHAVKAVDGLVQVGSKEATDAARGILRNPDLQGPDTGFSRDDFPGYREGMDRSSLVVRLAQAGYPEGYQIYLRLLDVKGNEYGKGSYGTPIAKLAVNEILQSFGKDDAALQKAREIKDFEQQRVAVRRWVEERMKKPIQK